MKTIEEVWGCVRVCYENGIRGEAFPQHVTDVCKKAGGWCCISCTVPEVLKWVYPEIPSYEEFVKTREM